VVSFISGKFEICEGLVYLEDVYVGGEKSVSKEKDYGQGMGGK
jgi:hypothetical protein